MDPQAQLFGAMIRKNDVSMNMFGSELRRVPDLYLSTQTETGRRMLSPVGEDGGNIAGQVMRPVQLYGRSLNRPNRRFET